MLQEEIRQRVIMEYLSGKGSLRTLAKRYECPLTRVYRWIMADKKRTDKQKLLHRVPVITGIPELNSMPTDVGWLQEQLRLSRIENQLLKATIDIADEQLGTDIRKNIGPRQS
jgi:transposase-like protein